MATLGKDSESKHRVCACVCLSPAKTNICVLWGGQRESVQTPCVSHFFLHIHIHEVFLPIRKGVEEHFCKLRGKKAGGKKEK